MHRAQSGVLRSPSVCSGRHRWSGQPHHEVQSETEHTVLVSVVGLRQQSCWDCAPALIRTCIKLGRGSRSACSGLHT